MQSRVRPVALAGRTILRRAASCVALCLSMIATIALLPEPARAGSPRTATCPATRHAARLQLALQAVAHDVAIRNHVQILAIGSSSTAGVGASSPSLTYPRQLEAALERRFAGVEVDVENAGVSGETADATVSRLERALQRVDRPDLVIWQVGTNDAIQAADEGRFQALLERGSAAAKRAGVGLILLDQQYYPSIPDVAGYERYVRIVEAVATKAGVGLFSRYRMMKEWDALGRGFLESMLSTDQFHMSDQGYQCMAQAFGREIASTVTALQRHVSSDVALGFQSVFE